MEIGIKDILVKNNIYLIQISVDKQLAEETENWSIILKSRDRTKEILLTSSYVVNDYIEISIPYLELESKLIEQDIWDLFLFHDKNGESGKIIRIKGGNKNYYSFTEILINRKKIIQPYETKNGNFSIKLMDYKVFSKIESCNFKRDNLNFSGYFDFPPLYRTDSYSIEAAKLYVTVPKDEKSEEITLKLVERERKGGRKCYEIEGEIDFKKYLCSQKTLQLLLMVGFKKTDGTIEEYTDKVKIVGNKKELPSAIIFNEGRKYKVSIKKVNDFTIGISHYNPRQMIINKVKNKWTKLRRGEKLKALYKLCFKLLGKLPVKKDLIVFESFLGKQYSDSPRAIFEYMQENKLNNRMYWSFDRRNIEKFDKRSEVKAVKRFSLRWLYLMARANYWVTNSRLPLWIPKPSHTIYIQTWHGTPLKRLAADMDQVKMPGTNTKKYKRNFLKEASKWDYLISPNEYSTEIFKRAFNFDGKILESGYPRNDFLVNSNNEEMKKNIKEGAQLPLNKKVILYAPTWRDNQFYGKGKYKFDLNMDFSKLKKELGEEYIIILRLHYLVAENLDLSEYKGFIFDLSNHEDIRELYLISDILITDYSSVFFDYANLKRPMIFYVYDLEDYRDNLRGFYFDFESKAPGPLLKSTTQIIQEVKRLENTNMTLTDKAQEFYGKFCYLEDGKATERVVTKIFRRN